MKKLNPKFLDMVTYSNSITEVEKTGTTDRLKNIEPLYCIKKSIDFGFVSIEENRLVICFQGSNDLPDWISNAKFFDFEINGVHADFYKSAEKFKNDLFEILNRYKDKEVFIVGHSRGGALAVMTAIYIYDNFSERFTNKSLKLMTFGAPKVITTSKRNDFNDKNIHYDNVQNTRDIVCDLGSPVFKTTGLVKVLPPKPKYFIPVIGRGISHKGYYDNIKRLS